MKLDHTKKLPILCIYFIVLAFAFTQLGLSQAVIWAILALSGAGWFVYEYKTQKPKEKRLRNAFKVGVSFMLFDFLFENMGFFMGLWFTAGSIFPILVVPIEVMMIIIFGGAAWALSMPDKFDKKISAIDLLFFSFWGAAGEYVLTLNGMMNYLMGWNSIHAFLGYAFAWAFVNYSKYKIFSR